MPARSFIDTSVLVYADDKAAPAKQRAALALLAEHRRARTGAISMQVLHHRYSAGKVGCFEKPQNNRH